MSAPVSFEFDFHGSVRLTVAEIWPDGDAPEKPTVKDVVAKITSHWMRSRMLEEMGLTDHVGCRITGPGGSEEVP